MVGALVSYYAIDDEEEEESKATQFVCLLRGLILEIPFEGRRR